MPPKQVKTTTQDEPEKQGIRVDPKMYAKLYNLHLSASDWEGCSANAILLYWWLCDKVTDTRVEDGVTYGVVMFGRPVSFQTIADENNLKSNWKTIQRNMQLLTDRGFILRKRSTTTTGYSYEVVFGVLGESETKTLKGKKYTKVESDEVTEEEIQFLDESKTTSKYPPCDMCGKAYEICNCGDAPADIEYRKREYDRKHRTTSSLDAEEDDDELV
ncbi:MAG TPA: hypothetical protein VG844_10720 [Terracidiphilus sp.]|nr:hypothetical protein [Terracidiphilus sp.]